MRQKAILCLVILGIPMLASAAVTYSWESTDAHAGKFLTLPGTGKIQDYLVCDGSTKNGTQYCDVSFDGNTKRMYEGNCVHKKAITVQITCDDSNHKGTVEVLD